MPVNHVVDPAILFPHHACGLFLSHNEHRDVYEPLGEYLRDRNKRENFADADALQRALDTDEYWELQWYPDTPVGFYVVAAPTLGEVLMLAHQTARADDAGHS